IPPVGLTLLEIEVVGEGALPLRRQPLSRHTSASEKLEEGWPSVFSHIPSTEPRSVFVPGYHRVADNQSLRRFVAGVKMAQCASKFASRP
ncbi:MAG TPA: hypothetical protein VKT70_06270, partial [Stellaceae bacterium]|nr:hypothetical protein [Stellaceae bacterium]